MGKTSRFFLIKFVVVAGLLFGVQDRGMSQNGETIYSAEIGSEADSLSLISTFGFTTDFLPQQKDSVITLKMGGREGWRGLTLPTSRVTFGELLKGLWMQGITGTDSPDAEPTIVAWDEKKGGRFIHPQNMSDLIESGKGFFVYLSEDDQPRQPGKQGGFPKTLKVFQDQLTGVVSSGISATDANNNEVIDGTEGFNLLGNPFGQAISVGAVKEAIKLTSANINEYLYVWNPDAGNGNGNFQALRDHATIGPYRPFWVRFLDTGTEGIVRFDRRRLAADNAGEKHSRDTESFGSFSIRLTNGEIFDSYTLALNERGERGEDPLDAYKIPSLKAGAVSLYSTAGNGAKITRNTLPLILDEKLEIPLSFTAAGEQVSFAFNWQQPDNLPGNWKLYLIDRQTKREINIRRVNSYSFELNKETAAAEIKPDEPKLLNHAAPPGSEGRFVLRVIPSAGTGRPDDPLPEAISLKPNYPNPFTASTTIPFELDEETDLKLTVWNMIGQKVATLVDGLRSAGVHNDVRWNASNLPSGMYIVRLEAEGEVFTRKMTLIK